MLCLKIHDKEWKTIAVAKGEEEVNLMCVRTYQPGDKIVLEASETDEYYWFQVDDALGRSMIFLKGNACYPIPFGVERLNLSPKAFMGEKHLLSARRAKPYEIEQYRNLAYSVVDHHANDTYFPHVTANVETRGEAVFAAQNAIDGITVNHSHGEWPYGSWGINQQRDARIRLEFGRMVKVDRIVLYLRADFPHDSWWEQAEVSFSDKSKMTVKLEKTDQAQVFTMEPKTINWLELGKLIKAKDASPYPALTQIEVYGVEKDCDLL